MIEHRQLLKLLNVHFNVRDHLSNRFPEGPTHIEIRGRSQKGGQSQVETYAIERAKLSTVIDALDRSVADLGQGPPTFHRDIVRKLYWEGKRPSRAIAELGLSSPTYYRRRGGALELLLEGMNERLTDVELRAFFVAYSSVFGSEIKS